MEGRRPSNSGFSGRPPLTGYGLGSSFAKGNLGDASLRRRATSARQRWLASVRKILRLADVAYEASEDWFAGRERARFRLSRQPPPV